MFFWGFWGELFWEEVVVVVVFDLLYSMDGYCRLKFFILEDFWFFFLGFLEGFRRIYIIYLEVLVNCFCIGMFLEMVLIFIKLKVI